MLKKELAALLGISGAMVTKLAKRGMPTDDLERAQRWRRRHLELPRMKGVRFDRNQASGTAVQPGDAAPRAAPERVQASTAAEVNSLAALALDALQLGETDRALAALRAAMRRLPTAEREHVEMAFDVLDALMPKGLLDDLEMHQAELDASGQTTLTTPEEDERMGHFWFKVAIGEIRFLG